MKDETRQRMEAASRGFDATSAADTSPLGAYRRAEARLELFRALVADGWKADDRALEQAALDEATVSEPAPAGATDTVKRLRVA